MSQTPAAMIVARPVDDSIEQPPVRGERHRLPDVELAVTVKGGLPNVFGPTGSIEIDCSTFGAGVDGTVEADVVDETVAGAVDTEVVDGAVEAGAAVAIVVAIVVGVVDGDAGVAPDTLEGGVLLFRRRT